MSKSIYWVDQLLVAASETGERKDLIRKRDCLSLVFVKVLT